MEYVICVDAGGTKSAASAISTSNGSVLCTHICGAGNLSTNPDGAQANIEGAIAGCLLQNAPAALVVGAAGVSGFSEKEAFCTSLQERFGCPAYLISDAELGLYAAFHGDDGILCIAGTGSILYGKKDNHILRCGGWGHLLGDEGSGCAVGLAALRAIVNRWDCAQNQPSFCADILELAQIHSVPEIPTFVYQAQKAQIAALMPAVEKAAQSGDPCAAEILKTQGALLAQTALRLCRNLQYTNPRILPMGGAVLKSKLLYSAFADGVQRELPEALLVTASEDFVPQRGGYYFWLTTRRL